MKENNLLLNLQYKTQVRIRNILYYSFFMAIFLFGLISFILTLYLDNIATSTLLLFFIFLIFSVYSLYMYIINISNNLKYFNTLSLYPTYLTINNQHKYNTSDITFEIKKTKSILFYDHEYLVKGVFYNKDNKIIATYLLKNNLHHYFDFSDELFELFINSWLNGEMLEYKDMIQNEQNKQKLHEENVENIFDNLSLLVVGIITMIAMYFFAKTFIL